MIIFSVMYHSFTNDMEDKLQLSQIKKKIISPPLLSIGLGGVDAVNIIAGTGLVESGYKYTKQLGGGPALGWFQMEPETHDDCWTNFLDYRPDLAGKIRSLINGMEPTVYFLQTNAFYAVAMCRIKYLRAPGGIPDTATGMADYHKEYYNTVLGKADASKNISSFQEAIDA